MWLVARCLGVVILALALRWLQWQQPFYVLANPGFYLFALKDPLTFITLALMLGAIFIQYATVAATQDPKVDMSKWVSDANSGEFYKITKKFGNSYSYDTTPYSKRLGAWIWSWKMRRDSALKWLVLGLVVIVGCTFIPIRVAADIGQLVGLLVVIASLWCWAFAARGYAAEVGPQPAPKQGREAVDSEKVHGDSGFASGDEIDRVTRRMPPIHQTKPVFED